MFALKKMLACSYRCYFSLKKIGWTSKLIHFLCEFQTLQFQAQIVAIDYITNLQSFIEFKSDLWGKTLTKPKFTQFS